MTKDDIPDRFWWWTYYRVARMTGSRIRDVMSWPYWEVLMHLDGDFAYSEWEADAMRAQQGQNQS